MIALRRMRPNHSSAASAASMNGTTSAPQPRPETRNECHHCSTGALVGDERDDREHREREQRDRADLVADARVDRGDRAALRLAARHSSRAHTCMITGSTIGRRFVRS